MVEEIIEIHVVASEGLVGVTLLHNGEAVLAANGIVLVLGVLLHRAELGWVHETSSDLRIPVCLQRTKSEMHTNRNDLTGYHTILISMSCSCTFPSTYSSSAYRAPKATAGRAKRATENFILAVIYFEARR